MPAPEGPYGAKGVGEAPVVGVPGAVANAIQASATALGPKMAINALEAGEDHGLKEYDGALRKLDASGDTRVQSTA